MKIKFLLFALCFYLTSHAQLLTTTIIKVDAPFFYFPPMAGDSVTFGFTLDTSSNTSAGIYYGNTLIRTIWSNKRLPAGAHRLKWDGKNDYGNFAAPALPYYAKVISNNIQTTWQGGVGNTSETFFGNNVRHNFTGYIPDIAFSGGFGYVANAYDEGVSSKTKFAVNRPNFNYYVMAKGMDCKAVDADNNFVYWLGIDPNVAKVCFIAVTKVSDDREASLSAGHFYKTKYGEAYASAIGFDSTTTGIARPKGIAVQKGTGKNFLYYSVKNLDKIYILNKNTGAFVGSKNVSSPGKIWLQNDTALFITSNDSLVYKMPVATDGSLGSASANVPNLVNPLAGKIKNDTLFVCDGGTSQQVKFFNANTLSYLGLYGQAGGYATNSTVANNKFWFKDPKHYSGIKSEIETTAYISFQPDGTIWVSDNGNSRQLHFTPSFSYINQIMNLGFTYACNADPNNPTRIFANYMEFSRDYSKTLDNGTNGSWSLTHNWSGGLDVKNDNQYFRLRNVTTLSNGRTYAISNRGLKNDDGQTDQTKNNATIVELVEGGTIRYTGLSVGPNNQGISNALNKDGSLAGILNTSVGGKTLWTKTRLIGFDGSNNPIYGATDTIASVPAITGDEPISNGKGSLFANAVSTSGAIFSFVPELYDTITTRGAFFHFGAAKSGNWLFKTSKVTHRLYRGPYPTTEHFDIGNSVRNPGGFAYVVDSIAGWDYHGEFWKGSQVNMYSLFHESGLLLGLFGTDGIKVKVDNPTINDSYPGMAGNSIYGQLVRVGSDLYLYNPDEFQHGFIHSTLITRLNTIKIQNVPLEPGIPDTLPGVDLMQGLPGLGQALINNYAGWSRMPVVNDTFTNVSTGIKTYDLFQPSDVYIDNNRGINSITTVTRALPLKNVSSFQITGTIMLDHRQGGGGPLFDFLDVNGKIIARIYDSFYVSNDYRVLGNKMQLGKYGTKESSNILGQHQPFSISSTNGSIVITYMGNTITAPVYDPSANWQQPGSIIITIQNKAIALRKIVGIATLRYNFTDSGL